MEINLNTDAGDVISIFMRRPRNSRTAGSMLPLVVAAAAACMAVPPLLWRRATVAAATA